MEQVDLTPFIGKRVRLIQAVDNYPDVFVPEGNTGILSQVHADCVWIKLDTHFPELNEWDNEVQIWDWSEQNDGMGHPRQYLELI